LPCIEEKFQKNASVMSDKDKRDLQKQAEGKSMSLKGLADAVQKRANEVQQDMLKNLIPKTEVVVEELRKAGNYDIIIEKKNVIFADPSVDLTKKLLISLMQLNNFQHIRSAIIWSIFDREYCKRGQHDIAQLVGATVQCARLSN
jgi:hypothetical protein